MFKKKLQRHQIIKICCYIWVLAIIVITEWIFLAVTNAVTTVNDCWPAVSLSTVLHAREFKDVNNNATLELNRAYSKGTSYSLFLFVLVSWSYDKYFSLIMSTNLSKKTLLNESIKQTTSLQIF